MIFLQYGEGRMDTWRSARMVQDRPTVEDLPGLRPDAEAGTGGGGGEIRCPLCGWTPTAEDLWTCRCSHSWNTFDTGGVCPNCLYRWTNTQCLACQGWSPHSDWYPKG
jgi:hypothetical protein